EIACVRLGARERVVQLELELSAERRILVVTGPNAGGKTVSLKTAGLLAAAAQSGVPIPHAPGRRRPAADPGGAGEPAAVPLPAGGHRGRRAGPAERPLDLQRPAAPAPRSL